MEEVSFGDAVPHLLSDPDQVVLAGKLFEQQGGRNLYSEIAVVNLSPAPALIYRLGIIYEKGESFTNSFAVVASGIAEVCFSEGLHRSWLDALDAENRTRFLDGPDSNKYKGVVTFAVDVLSSGHVYPLRWPMHYHRKEGVGPVQYFEDAR